MEHTKYDFRNGLVFLSIVIAIDAYEPFYDVVLGTIFTWHPSTNLSVDKNMTSRASGVGHRSEGKNRFFRTNVDSTIFIWTMAYLIPMQFLGPALNGRYV